MPKENCLIRLRALVILLLALFLCACRDDVATLAGVQLRLVNFLGVHPATVSFEDHPLDSVEPAPRARGSMTYLVSQDSIHVVIEEFRDPVAAYAYWLNKGLGPEHIPHLRSGMLEMTTCSGKWVFYFQSLSHRLPPQESMDSLVASFPETGGGLPKQFLSLPMRQRIPQGASVQANLFLGCPVRASMLCQRYRDELGPWSAARSLGPVSESQMDSLVKALSAHGVQWESGQDGYTTWRDGAIRVLIGRENGLLISVWAQRDAASMQALFNHVRTTLRAE